MLTIIEEVGLPALITTSVLSAQPATFTFPGSTDTVSLQYSNTFGDGSGMDICGPRSYEIFEIDG